MSRINWLLWVANAVLVVVPVAAHAGGLSEGDHGAFAIRSVDSAGDVKRRWSSGVSAAAIALELSIKAEELWSGHPWKMAIVSTVFWVGETGSGPTNVCSAWDTNWLGSYGGVDDPVRRNGYEPSGFRPLENPFYVALPYSDMQSGRLKPEAAKVVPWFITEFQGVGQSVCKGRWLEIRHGPKVCYAQWEDAGPFRTDSAGYVFGSERPSPNVNHGAGIDVSPAVRDYLGLGSSDMLDWRFVDQVDVPAGPWSLYDRSENPGGGSLAMRWQEANQSPDFIFRGTTSVSFIDSGETPIKLRMIGPKEKNLLLRKSVSFSAERFGKRRFSEQAVSRGERSSR